MLAYVFWHWPRAEPSAAEYEQLQRAFHAALAQSPPRGFGASLTFRVAGEAAWLAGAPAYADWYLVEDSAALDALNAAAVSGVSEVPHARVAQAMSAGAGSLFALHATASAPDLPSMRQATFLTKPRDMPYATFYAEVDALPEASARSLWRRQMVLGPTPEFALLSATPLSPPASLQPLTLSLSRI